MLLDISATTEDRETMLDVVKRVAEIVSVPFTVGGGVRTFDDIAQILEAGADKVGINSAAVDRPVLIKEAAETFGSKRIVAAVDAEARFRWVMACHDSWWIERYRHRCYPMV